MPRPQIFDHADHRFDEFLVALKLLGRDGRRVVDNVALKNDRYFHSGSAKINSDGQGTVAHFGTRPIDSEANGTFFSFVGLEKHAGGDLAQTVERDVRVHHIDL